MARVYANVNAQLGPGWYDYGAFDCSLWLNEDLVRLHLIIDAGYPYPVWLLTFRIEHQSPVHFDE